MSVSSHGYEGWVFMFSQSNMCHFRNPKIEELPHEARLVMVFLEMLCRFSGNISRKSLEGYLPPYMFDHFTH